MERKKTYEEVLKEQRMRENEKEGKGLEWQREILLNDVLERGREEQVGGEIDVALDEREEEGFMKV